MEDPRHIAIILDGNRRYARKQGLEALRGHEFGLRKIEQLLDWLFELGIRETTLWCFSTDNFKRDSREVDYLMGLFQKKFTELAADKRVHENNVRIRFLGRLEMLPASVRQAALNAQRATESYERHVLNIALAYGGRAEIVDAARKAAEAARAGALEPSSLNEESFGRFLYSQSEPDIIIRTSGEIRTSGFLPWQGAYSEWFFLQKLWPEMEKQDLVNVLEEYRQRKRRFGS